MASSNPSSSARSQASLSVPAQDEKTNGETAPVDDSGTNKEDIKDNEHPNNSYQDNDGAEGGDLDNILDQAGNEVTKNMGFK
ncbi:hypothetical protein FPOAC2_13598 [Fusarium poae]|jgi:hypothetical protein